MLRLPNQCPCVLFQRAQWVAPQVRAVDVTCQHTHLCLLCRLWIFKLPPNQPLCRIHCVCRVCDGLATGILSSGAALLLEAATDAPYLTFGGDADQPLAFVCECHHGGRCACTFSVFDDLGRLRGETDAQHGPIKWRCSRPAPTLPSITATHELVVPKSIPMTSSARRMDETLQCNTRRQD
jgi:hypothetical protein